MSSTRLSLRKSMPMAMWRLIIPVRNRKKRPMLLKETVQPYLNIQIVSNLMNCQTFTGFRKKTQVKYLTKKLMKVMAEGKNTGFFEDYTYNLVPGKEAVLESHMLEVCPSCSDGKVFIRVNPLSMGDREDPARLVFTSKEGKGIATSLIDLGTRFRLIVSEVESIKCPEKMPNLPVASSYWRPEPDLLTGAKAWILAGGAHHTAFSYDITSKQMQTWADAMGIEMVRIGKDTTIDGLKDRLRWNEAYYEHR